MSGLIIALEGIDQSGKTTISKLLLDKLTKIPNKFSKISLRQFPDRSTFTGKIIDDFLNGKNEVNQKIIQMLFTCNRYEVKQEDEQKLNNNELIIYDRSQYSGIVYGMAHDLDKEWCYSLEKYTLEPDLIFYLDITPEKASRRRLNMTPDRYENIKLQKKVYKIYQDISKEEGFISIDATLNKNKIVDIITECILKFNKLYLI